MMLDLIAWKVSQTKSGPIEKCNSNVCTVHIGECDSKSNQYDSINNLIYVCMTQLVRAPLCMPKGNGFKSPFNWFKNTY